MKQKCQSRDDILTSDGQRLPFRFPVEKFWQLYTLYTFLRTAKTLLVNNADDHIPSTKNPCLRRLAEQSVRERREITTLSLMHSKKKLHLAPTVTSINKIIIHCSKGREFANVFLLFLVLCCEKMSILKVLMHFYVWRNRQPRSVQEGS